MSENAVGGFAGAVEFDWRGRLGRNQHVFLPHSDAMSTKGDWTMTMWLATEQDDTPKWRQFLLKGEQVLERSISAWVYPATGRIRLSLTTKTGEQINVHSTTTVRPYTPAHLAIVRTGKHLRLFVNGVHDSTVVATNLVDSKDGLHLGNLASHVSHFKWTKHALLESAILKDVYGSRQF